MTVNRGRSMKSGRGNMAAPAKRIDGIDFWRGFALLTIFIDHMPESIFQHVTQKNFGFSDAAELFVFLSGVSIALAYGTRFFDGEAVVAVRAVLRRAFTLYWVQILISLLIIAMFAGAAALWDDDNLLEDADAVVSNPLQTTAAILALLHQLDNANILPLYIALLLMTPLLLVLARRDDRLMLAAAAGIYLAARAFSLNLSTWPVEGTWFFNPIAWQFIFAIGIFAGRRFKRGGIAYDARLFAACLAVVAIAAVVRTDAFGYASGLWQDVHDVLDCGKTDLGFARLVHFLALAYIVYHSGLTGLMRRTRAFLPLCLIGRYGLPVFATGIVLSAMGEVIETRSEALSHQVAFGAAIVVGGILMHYLVARGLAAWRDKSRAPQSMMNWAQTLRMASPRRPRIPLRFASHTRQRRERSTGGARAPRCQSQDWRRCIHAPQHELELPKLEENVFDPVPQFVVQCVGQIGRRCPRELAERKGLPVDQRPQ